MKQEEKHHLSIQKNREGIDLIKNGEKDIAYEYFCEAINLNPRYPPPYFNLGNILMEKIININLNLDWHMQNLENLKIRLESLKNY